jgi:hypothetical protein
MSEIEVIEVIEILKKYMNIEYKHQYKSLHDFFTDFTSPNCNEIIESITRKKGGLFSSDKIKLRDELLPYPNIKLIFELHPRYVSMNAYNSMVDVIFDINAQLFNEWYITLNKPIYDNYIKNKPELHSKLNPNWILVPYNLRKIFMGNEYIKRNV